MIPAKPQANRQSGSNPPRIVDIQADLLLLKIEVTAVVLIPQVGGKAQQQRRESRAGKGCLRFRARVIETGPGAVKIVRTFGLLQFFDVVVFLTALETELYRVLAFHPRDVVVNLERGQILMVV